MRQEDDIRQVVNHFQIQTVDFTSFSAMPVPIDFNGFTCKLYVDNFQTQQKLNP